MLKIDKVNKSRKVNNVEKKLKKDQKSIIVANRTVSINEQPSFDFLLLALKCGMLRYKMHYTSQSSTSPKRISR